MANIKKKIIPIEVRGEYILGSGVSIGAVGSYDSVILRVKFDESWIGLSKYATWCDALGNVGDQTIITAVDLVEGEDYTYDILVPAFATTNAGTARLSFTGYAVGGTSGKTVESLINTASGSFRVLESNATPIDRENTAASVAAQLLYAVSEIAEDTNAWAENWTDRIDAVEAAEGSIESKSGRAWAEKLREDAEEERQTEEDKRYDAELERTAAEGSIESKSGRAWAEKLRVDAETSRIANEEQRQANEIERNALVGDLDAALDELHAYAQALIGGGGA